MTTEQLAALRTELQTQDNAATAHPLYCVFQKQRIYGLDSDHAEHFVWLSPDDGDGRRETDEDAPGAERVGYIDVDRFVTACLTRKSAKDFIERNSHRLRKPFVYVESLHRNEEMIAIRAHLMDPPCST
jgi:hypothetical protein